MDKKQLINFEFETKQSQDTHFHQNLELLYLLEGVAELQIENLKYQMNRGDFVLINSNKKHSFRSEGQVLYVEYEVDYGILAEYMESNQLLFWCNTMADKNDTYGTLQSVLDRILNRYFEKNDTGRLYLNSLYFQVVYLLTSYFRINLDDARLQIPGMQDDARIFEIQNYVQSNYHQQISLNDLASQLFLSNAYLSKYIKKKFGLSFLEYLNNVRLFHAIDDLIYTNKKMIHIALDNGFPTTASFNKSFKQYYNMTPSAYRDKVTSEAVSGQGQERHFEELEGKIQDYLAGITAPKEVIRTQRREQLFTDSKFHVPLQKPWGKVINIGDAFSLLRSDVQEHILLLKKELGFSHVRIWSIFEVSMYHEDDNGVVTYNFSKIDRVLDFLLQHQMRPFIDLSFKPNQVMASNQEMLLSDQRTIIFNSSESYSNIMRGLASHLVNRYGTEEVEQWYFELWRDPRMQIESPEGWYYGNFEIGYTILKEVVPKVKVGGAGFILGYETHQLREIFRIWKRREIVPDFISVYSYRYVTLEQNGRMYGKKSLDKNFTKNQLAIVRTFLKEEGFEVPEIYVTEWNYTISNRNVLNDSCAQAAYIVQNCIDAEGITNLLAYWHGTDLYSEYYDTKAIVNGDSGLLTRDGIKKPSFYAFYFLDFLQNRVLGKNEYAMVTANGRGNYAIVCHNSKMLTYRYSMKEENEILIDDMDSLFEEIEPIELEFTIDDIKDGDYLLKTYYINRRNGSVQDAWKDLECMETLSKEEIDYLRHNSRPNIKMKRIHVEGGKIVLSTKLLAHEIRALELIYQF